MRALSIRQPWAWLIVNGFKDIENRTWQTRYRGAVLVHASKGMTNDEYEDVEQLTWLDKRIAAFNIELPDRKELERGGVVGIMHIDGCVSASDSPWFFGPEGFLLRDAKPLPFVPFKGQLGFFDVPSELIPGLAKEPA